MAENDLGEMRKLERSLAYEFASQILTGNCRPVGPKGEDWWDTTNVNELASDDFEEAMRYLDFRGVLDRHPVESGWVSLRDESEAVVQRSRSTRRRARKRKSTKVSINQSQEP